MTLVWSASELLTGKKFQDKGLIVAFKNGRQTYSSTTVGQFDADLKITLPKTSARYFVEVNYGTSGTTTADINLAWNVTGNAEVFRTTQAMEINGTTPVNTAIISREMSTAGWVAGTALAGVPCAVRESLVVFTSTQPTTLTLVWCQNVSSGTGSSVHDYSWAVARRLT